MSRLMGDLFHQSPLLVWPLISLVIFVLTFVAVVIWAFLRKPSEIDELSAMPLANDHEGGPS
jgi:hypothetical protein